MRRVVAPASTSPVEPNLDVDGRVAAVSEDLELARQRSGSSGGVIIADLHRRRRRVRCYWPQRLVACQQGRSVNTCE